MWRVIFAAHLCGFLLTAQQGLATAPVIARHPAGATYAKEANARFFVNAYSIDSGYLSYQWYRSVAFAAPQTDENTIKTGATALPEGTAATLNTTTPSGSDTQYFYYWVRIANNKNGNSDYIESAVAQAKIVDRTLHTSLMQGDFEGIIGSGYYAPLGDYWNTTHDGHSSDDNAGYTGTTANPRKILEISGSVTYGTYSNNSTRVAELSPYVACSNYQEIATMPGKVYEWSLDHAARRNGGDATQTMAIVIGPAINMPSDYDDFGITDRWKDESAVTPPNYPYGTNYTTYFYDILNNLVTVDLGMTIADLRTMDPDNSAPYTTTYGGNTYYVYLASNKQVNDYFIKHSGVYSVPAGQGTTVFGFVPMTYSSSYGNLIDNVVFASGSPVAPSPSITYDNDVSLSVPTKEGYTYGIVEVRGSSVRLVVDAEAYYDPDGNGASPETAISRTAGLGIDGWYSTYGADMPFDGAGVIAFKNLTPGKTYRIVGIPILAINDGLHVNESPEYVFDADYYSDVMAMPAYAGDASTIWNIEIETYQDGAAKRARIAVDNARNDVEYALLSNDGTGNPATASSAHAHTGWTAGTAGRAVFSDLDLDTYYYLIARPAGYAEVTYTDAAYDIDGTTPKYIPVKTPGTVEDVDGSKVSRGAANCLSIALSGSRAGYTYAVVDPVTGAIIGGEQNGDGTTLTFAVADASKAYRIVARHDGQDVNWMRGILVYGCPDDFSIDYSGEAVRSSRDASGNIPANVEYYIRGKDAGQTQIVGSPEAWTAGIGTQPVDLSTKILAGNTKSILDSIASTDADAMLYYRTKAEDGYDGRWVSPVKEIVIPRRPPSPDKPGDYAFDYVGEQLDVVADSLHFAQTGASQWTSRLTGASWTFADAGWSEGASARPFNVRFPATSTTFASLVRTDTIPTRPDAPEVDLKSNGAISRIVITDLTGGTAYQYHTNTLTAWQDFTPNTYNESDSIAFTPTDTCYVRYAATVALPASFIAVLTVTPLVIRPVYFTSYSYGATPVTATVQIRNRVNAAIAATLTPDGVNASSYDLQNTGSTTIPASGANTDWKLTPKNSLDAGAHNTRLKLSYTHNSITYTAYADVYLTVEKTAWDMSGIAGVFDVSQSKARQLVLNISGAPAGANLAYYYGTTPVPGDPAPASVVNTSGEATYTFTSANGLQPASTYTVSVLAQGDNNHNESPLTALAAATGYTAYETPAFDQAITIDYINERLTFRPGYSSGDYTLGCATCSGSPEIASPYSLSSIIDDAANDSLVFTLVRKAGVSPPYPASEAGLSDTVQGRAAAPAVSAASVTAASGISTNDGRIHIAGQFEYRMSGASFWSLASGAASGLLVGDYDVRYPATATSFASHTATVTISSIIEQPSPTVALQCFAKDTLSVAIAPTTKTVEYQWYQCDDPAKTNPRAVGWTGATTDSLPIPQSLVDGTYYYYCEITIAGTFVLVSDVSAVVRATYPEVSLSGVSIADGGNNSVVVTAHIVNHGDAAIGPPVYVSLYRDEVLPSSRIITGSANLTITPGGTGDVPITIPDITADQALHLILIARVNDDGTTFPYAAECDDTNDTLALPNTRLVRSMEKHATLRRDNVVLLVHDGIYANPVSVLYGDTIEYEITVVNPAGSRAIVRDTLPLYLRYASTVGASLPAVATHVISTQTNEPDVLTWTVSGFNRATPRATVTLRATPVSGASASQQFFPNHAWIGVIDNNNDTTAFLTNYTYHQGAGASIVTFSASAGGRLYNADRQAVDYSTSPRSGVIAAPDEGYRFAGWEHAGYYSHRGAFVSPSAGIERYDTLAVYGNVNLHARFEPNRYPIRYLLNGGMNAAANPPSYTVEDAAITLAPPFKAGDVFTGWTGSCGDAPVEAPVIPAGSTGDRTYYANYLYSGREAVVPSEAIDRVWSACHELYVRTSRANVLVRVYTPDGLLHRLFTIPAPGITKHPLLPGIYIVTLNDGAGKKVVITPPD
jgi:uncharacterized repeat protein (TIGR02543 family)